MTYLAPQEYLPHRSPMLLIDRIVEIADQSVTCEVSSKVDGTLYPLREKDGSIHSAYFVEMMAQCVGIWAGAQRIKREATLVNPTDEEKAADIGLLLSVRDAKFTRTQVPVDQVMTVHMTCLMIDNNLATFEGDVRLGEDVLSSGRVTVYQPSQAELKKLFAL